MAAGPGRRYGRPPVSAPQTRPEPRPGCPAHQAVGRTADRIGDQAAVKSGFASGYGGEGPAALSYALQLLEAHGVELEEVEVSADLIERLDDSALTVDN